MYPEKYTPSEQPTLESFQAVTEAVAGSIVKDKETRDSQEGKKRPYVVAVEGPMASGKGTLAQSLADTLRAEGKKVQVISIDHYMNPAAIRKQPGEPARVYYEHTINIGKFENEVLRPIDEEGVLKGDAEVFNVENEEQPIHVRYDVDEDTIVIVEGIFVLKRGIRGFYDKTIYYDVSEEHVRLSAAARNEVDRPDKPRLTPDELMARMDSRYVPGYEMYLKEDNPAGEATMVIERRAKGFRIESARGKSGNG